VRRPVLVVACAVLAAGCAKRGAAPAPRLVEVRVVDRAAASGAGEPYPGAVDGRAIEVRVLGELRAARAIAIADGSEARDVDYRLKVEVALQRDDAGPGALRAFVVARMEREGATGEPPIESRIAAERSLPPGLDARAARAHLERAVDDAIAALVSRVRLRLGGAGERLAALRGADPDLRSEAIRDAALRRDKDAVPALIELLSVEDRATRDLALGALVEIGDRRAVKPITHLARFQDVAELPKVIDAVAALGGDEARAYLEFVISTHEDAEIRALAKEALGRLDRRAAAAP